MFDQVQGVQKSFSNSKITQKIPNGFDIRCGDIKIKYKCNITYSGRILDNNISGESVSTKVLGVVNGRLNLLIRNETIVACILPRMLL